MGVPAIPSSLAPQVPLDSEITVHDPFNPQPAKVSSIAQIANLETPFFEDYHHDEESDMISLEICAYKSNRQRCQACLLGFHQENDCYLRGIAFQLPELRRRL